MAGRGPPDSGDEFCRTAESCDSAEESTADCVSSHLRHKRRLDFAGAVAASFRCQRYVWKSTNAGSLSPNPASIDWTSLTDDQPPASVNSSAVFNATLTAVNGYGSTVSLSCGPGAPPACVLSPASTAPSASGRHFTATVSSSISQSYSFNINGVGTDPAAIAHSTAVNFTAMPSQNSDFTMTLTPTIAAVAAGQSTIFSLDIAPTTGTFPNNVTLSCSALPALTTCAFNPVQIDSGSGDSVITLSISTTHFLPRTARDAAMFLPTLPLVGLFWLALPAYRSKRRRIPLAALVVFLAVVCLSCGSVLQGNGGSGSPGTPPGTYNVKVTSGTLTHSTQLTLTVTP
jgi:hypothetical protein